MTNISNSDSDNAKSDSTSIANWDKTLIICYLLYSLSILFNFLGLPLLKVVYVAETIFTIWICFRGPISRSLVPLFMYLLVEGQGRIIMDYAQWTRITFDLCLLFVVIREMIENKVIFPLKILPSVILVPMLLFLVWYFVQFFNPHSPSILMQLIALKMYIFPLMYFIFLSRNNNAFNDQTILNLNYFIIFASITQSILCIYQFNKGEEFLFGISNYYKTILNEEKGTFTGFNFRPTGMGFGPASFGSYLYLLCGLYLLAPVKKYFKYFIVPIAIALNYSVLFISQIRSGMIKYSIVLLAIGISAFWINRKKEKLILWFILASLILIPLSRTFQFSENFWRDNNLIASYEKFGSLLEESDIGLLKGSNRLTFEKFWNLSYESLSELPIGLGPGRLGPPGVFFVDALNEDRFYGNNFNTWHYENIYYSIISEMGYGGFSFIFLILIIPIYFVPYFFKLLIRKELYAARKIAVSAIILFTILVGNWASFALTLIPETFIFWFYAGLGINTIRSSISKNDEIKNVQSN